MPAYILAIDQGTTGTTALLVARDLSIRSRATVDFPQHFPQPGWVEHDPEEIWASVRQAIARVLAEGDVSARHIAAIGITNQRETTLLWERASGRAVHPAIVWQCRRSAEICRELRQRGVEELFRHRTGLVLDPYFSGTKLTWIFRGHPDLRRRAETGEVAFGTVDTFLTWRLSGGKAHVTDPSNASRTLLMNLETLDWDSQLCTLLDVPPIILPGIADSSAIYGYTAGLDLLPDGIPIAGIAGDQQAALFGQACFAAGEAKCTYGTGAFLLENTGTQIVRSGHGLLTTVAWRLNGQACYALEGSAFIAGAAVQWLRDGLGLVRTSAEIEPLAASVADSGGVVFVPALTGLGAPHWKSGARGSISGITRGTTAAHLARATLEGIALQIYDLAAAMEQDRGDMLKLLKVDGGAANNNLLMQLQADLLGLPVVRPATVETTALGAAMLAGLGVGFWSGQRELEESWREECRFAPRREVPWREDLLQRWHEAVAKA
ncbi:MAG: glycerol kinase [Desulfuromonadales bacterium GWD2_61_12]|nr:MAG: glycerol kinase [Desulfuromonadales bacterium GWC2_61_20]OGR36530.1 MAG: glycerol kinase [Desulfuromonadales bacterium GWD2_61_12]HAD05078.1 glycerol kinase [Desulfuromonas sp.]HBT83979.1 glycerol kinase [Desulfuromonas sp.]